MCLPTGGAIYINSKATVTNSTFLGNKSGYNSDGYGNLEGGGAIFINVQPGTGRTPLISSSVFHNNDANFYYGGALSITGDSAKTENCIFSDNKARYGGALFTNNTNWAINPKVFNSVFYNNNAYTAGGGIAMYGYSYIEIVNSIIWGNTSPSGTFTGGMPTITYSDVDEVYEGQGNINLNPLFVDALNNDFHLLPNSPCIDAGTDIADLTIDIEGNERPIGLGYDMGPYEYQE